MAKGITKSWGTLGGSGKMHGFKGAGTQTPGGTSQEGSGGRRDQKAKGGGNVGFYSTGTTNRDYAGTREAGTTSPTKSGPNDKFAHGGSTKMFGNTGSGRLEGGRTAK